MSVNALYSYLSHEHFYFWENANLELPLEIAMFYSEINAYFAVKFRYENPFASAQNLRKAVLYVVLTSGYVIFWKFEPRLILHSK